MDTIREIPIYLLCVLATGLMLCSPILTFFGFLMLPSRAGKVLFYSNVLIWLLVIAGIIIAS